MIFDVVLSYCDEHMLILHATMALTGLKNSEMDGGKRKSWSDML